MVEVETTWLEHEGGTKFYETVLLKTEDSSQAMLIKRYGPMDRSLGGGQIIIEKGTVPLMRAAANKIIAEKTTSRKGYGIANKNFGLHAFKKGTKHSISEIHSLRHYRDANARTTYDEMRAYFGDDTPAAPFPTPAPVAVPEPEINRGSTWGSF